MEKNLDIVATELFGKIRSQFPKIKLGDEEGSVTDEPSTARFFEFEYTKDGVPLGTVSVSLSEDEGLVVMYSNNILEKENGIYKHQWFKFLKELREFAKQRLLNFDTRDISKSNLEKRDYQQMAKQNRPKSMSESKLWGTAKTSYQNMGESRIIVKHSQPINNEVAAGRARHIESIYIENVQGERFMYPFKHLNGARAMARHVANGGHPYDQIGEHIVGLSEELGKLRMFKGYVDRNPTISEAMDSIQSKVISRLGEVKKQIQNLHSQRYYESFVESFSAPEEKNIPEDIMNDWIDRLTIRTFNEELKNVFPYIYNLIDESELPIKEVSLEDIAVQEMADTNDLDSYTPIKEIDSFVAELDAITEGEEGIFSQDPQAQATAIENLNRLLSQEIPAGTDGVNAIESLTGIINDSELYDIFKEFADVNPEADVRKILQDYIQIKDEENGTDVAGQLSFSEQPVPAEQPAAPAEQPAAQEVTPAPQMAGLETQGSPFVEAVKRAAAAGMTLEDTFTVKGKTMSLKSALESVGINPDNFFTNKADELHEYVKSMFNAEEGTFPKGETGVLIAVEKKFGEGAVPHASKFIEQITMTAEQSRLQKLAGIASVNETEEEPEKMASDAIRKAKNKAGNKVSLNDLDMGEAELTPGMIITDTALGDIKVLDITDTGFSGEPASLWVQLSDGTKKNIEYDELAGWEEEPDEEYPEPDDVGQASSELARIKRLAGR